MYQDQIIDNEFQSSQGLAIVGQMREELGKAANWAYFLAILGFIGVGLMILAGLFMLVSGSALSDAMGARGMMGFPVGILSFVYFIMAALYTMPVLYLFRFSDSIKNALKSDDNQLLATGIANLASHYKFLGIMVIVIFSFYGLVIIGTLFLGLGSMI